MSGPEGAAGPAGTWPVVPLRSVLFVNGDQPDNLEAALVSGADAIVIDLEEARTPFPEHERERARAGVASFLAGLDPAPVRPRCFVRVQSIASGGTFRDLIAVLGPAVHGVLLPKARGPHDVHGLDALLTAVEGERGLPRGSTRVWPIIETAGAVRDAYDIATASPRVAYLGGAVSRFGDMARAIGYRWTVEGVESLYLRQKVLIDARAAGIEHPVSGMWAGAADDFDGVRAWGEHLRDLGYRGMMINSAGVGYIDVVNEVFSPSADEVAYWRELDRLVREAEAGDGARILHGDPSQGEGHVVHLAHIESARAGIRWAEALGLTE